MHVQELLNKKRRSDSANTLVLLTKVEREIEEMRECTFQPQTHCQPQNKIHPATIHRLYQQHRVDQIEKEKKRRQLEEQEMSECTFKPKINEDQNGSSSY